MAKRVTALKCPQCGSVKKQAIKEDHYICNNCDTEYFLDNDDININVNHKHSGIDRSPAKPIDPKKAAIIAIGIAVVFFAFVINLMFSNDSNSNATANSPNYSDRIYDQMAYSDKNGNPIILLSVERSYRGDSNTADETILVFYDPINKKVLGQQSPSTKWADSPTLYYRTFSDGKIYLIPDKTSRLYTVDTHAHKLVDVTDQIFNPVQAFSSGIATLDFAMNNFGDCLQVMTNDGKEFYYYPLADKAYIQDDREFKTDSEKLTSVPVGAQEQPHFIFSEKSSEYEEPIQLIKYWIKEKDGFPTRLAFSPTWGSTMNVVNGKAIHRKKLFPGYLERITRFEDISPERMYFEPEIVYNKDNKLYIKTLPNANPENKPLLQKIDTESGEVLWTYKLSDRYVNLNRVSVFQNGIGFYISNTGPDRKAMYILLSDKDGQPMNEVDLNLNF
ncbi:hypothetical protein FAZ15_09975 [Sphingobacterium olei]|uniref:Uncharacterized protein n=1 Tax=Sphingobacterium olei TaxID=2571155 RepID=A0A4V5MNH1_9SPHI|nr:hypothetical protein [Sphingobacterium olei]TJZ61508.1 hypothetical protein FAZ15_09975 [Sphingobacterium olei]